MSLYDLFADTNVILHMVNRAEGYERIWGYLKHLTRSEVAISSITAMELWHKTLNSKVGKRASAGTSALLNAYRILPFKGDAAKIGGQLLINARVAGKPIG